MGLEKAGPWQPLRVLELTGISATWAAGLHSRLKGKKQGVWNVGREQSSAELTWTQLPVTCAQRRPQDIQARQLHVHFPCVPHFPCARQLAGLQISLAESLLCGRAYVLKPDPHLLMGNAPALWPHPCSRFYCG